VWRAAIDVFRGPAPDESMCFIHRDFHYGNADGMSWHLDPKRDGLDRARRYESFITAAIGVVAAPNDRQ